MEGMTWVVEGPGSPPPYRERCPESPSGAPARASSPPSSASAQSHPPPSALPVDVGQDVLQGAAGVAGVNQGDDVGVLELGGEPDFPKEPLGAEHRGQLGAEHLEGDVAVVLEVVRDRPWPCHRGRARAQAHNGRQSPPGVDREDRSPGDLGCGGETP